MMPLLMVDNNNNSNRTMALAEVLNNWASIIIIINSENGNEK